jgi:hypothetical protein
LAHMRLVLASMLTKILSWSPGMRPDHSLNRTARRRGAGAPFASSLPPRVAGEDRANEQPAITRVAVRPVVASQRPS